MTDALSNGLCWEGTSTIWPPNMQTDLLMSSVAYKSTTYWLWFYLHVIYQSKCQYLLNMCSEVGICLFTLLLHSYFASLFVFSNPFHFSSTVHAAVSLSSLIETTRILKSEILSVLLTPLLTAVLLPTQSCAILTICSFFLLAEIHSFLFCR